MVVVLGDDGSLGIGWCWGCYCYCIYWVKTVLLLGLVMVLLGNDDSVGVVVVMLLGAGGDFGIVGCW